MLKKIMEWSGHVVRMDQGRVVKVFESKLVGITRRRVEDREGKTGRVRRICGVEGSELATEAVCGKNGRP